MTARLLAPLLLGGCSLLYNPSNLPNPGAEAGVPDVMIDGEVILDTDPSALAIDPITATLDEGTGAKMTAAPMLAGGAPALLVVTGRQLLTSGVTIAITAHDGTTDISQLVVPDLASLAVAADGRYLVVPVRVGIDPSKDHTAAPLALDVAVTQPSGGSTVTRIATGLTLTYYDKLTTAGALATGVHRYASVDIAASGLKATGDLAVPLQIRSNSWIHVVGTVDVSAVGVTPGPAGGVGGTAGAGGVLNVTPTGPGGKGGGASAGTDHGGGGGFGTAGGAGALAGTGGGSGGAVTVPVFDSANASSGGAGGAGTDLGVAGQAGGAGGGSIELAARGDLAVDALAANGAAGGASSNSGGSGGGGSGGAIVVRARGTLTIPMIGAHGAAKVGTGGAGGDGRIRIDNPTPSTIAATPAAYRGPMITAYPTITLMRRPMLTVAGKPRASFSYYNTLANGHIDSAPQQTLGTDGTATFVLANDLGLGINHLCVLVEGASPSTGDLAENCVDLAYVYKP